MANLFTLFRGRSISQKIFIAIFLISSLVSVAITALQVSYDYHQEINLLNKTLELIERSYSKSIVSSLWELNDYQIKAQLDGIISIPDVEYVVIQNDKDLFLSSGKRPLNNLNKSIKLVYYDKNNVPSYLGKMTVYGNIDHVLSKIYDRVFFIFISQFIKTLLVSFLIYISIQKLVTKHLIKISSFVKSIDLSSNGDQLVLDRVSRPKEVGMDELDVLVSSINETREKLYQSYHDLNRLNKELEENVEMKTQLVLKQTRQLEYSSRMSSLGEMAGGIAHEINNPIMIIDSSARMLRKSLAAGVTDPVKIGSYFDKITNTTERISKTIKGLLALSRDAEHEVFSRFKLKDVLTEVLLLCGEKIKFKGIMIKSNFEDKIFQTIIIGRRVQLSQVFLNLIQNSYDAIEDQGNGWINIECKCDENNFKIFFSDSGDGIPDDIQEKIMQPYFTTKEIGKGTGLGLSLSRAILKNHLGDLYLNRYSKNTCFVVVLPIKSIELPKDFKI